VPLRARETTLGALNAFCSAPLDAHQIKVAQALADAATVALLQADPDLDASVVARRIVETVESRNAVEQAIGVLSVRFECSASEALGRLREAARQSGESLVSIARAVVDRDSASPGAGSLRPRPAGPGVSPNLKTPSSRRPALQLRPTRTITAGGPTDPGW